MEDKILKCKRCDVDMEQLSIGPVIWRCPSCQIRYVYMDYRGLVPPGHELYLRGKSWDEVNGAPTYESGVDVSGDKDLFQQDINRSADEAVVKRRFELNSPYRRDAGGNSKQAEELSAVRRMLAKYNESHGTDYGHVESDPNDELVDVIAHSNSGLPELHFQVVMADNTIWRELAQGGQLEESISENQMIGRLAGAIISKATRAHQNIILVLDGPWVSSPATIERFRREYKSLMEEIQFNEIWYSERNPGNLVVRLK